jgi:hypothetical protein
MPKWLSVVNLSDPYDRKARLLPAVLCILPLLPASAALGGPVGEWIKLVLGGVGIGAVIAVGLSHAASACGNRVQKKLWPRWPSDSPTNRWLHPNEKKTSAQQRALWYDAIQRLLGIDLKAAVETDKKQEIEAAINDAVAALRNLFWKRAEAERLHMHNVDYGFARNLTGMFPIWGSFLVGSAAACWWTYWNLDPHALLWAVVATVLALVLLPIGVWVLPAYVRAKATYYAESFFATLMAVDKASSPRPVAT